MKTRIISGAVAIALLAAVLYFHNTVLFNVMLSLISGLMIYELFKAFNLFKEYVFCAGSLALAICMPFINDYLDIKTHFSIYFSLVFAYIVLYACTVIFSYGKTELGSVSLIFSYTLIICIAMTSLSVIESSPEFGLEYVILTFCGAWFADSGAYFAGTFFGKHKLCPEISPKKTVEGLAGGVVSNALVFMLFGFIVSLYSPDAQINYFALAALGVVCSILGLIGDLLASAVKRHCNIKDYGNIMPGHGGALDRFDSVLLTAPFMAVCLSNISVFG